MPPNGHQSNLRPEIHQNLNFWIESQRKLIIW